MENKTKRVLERTWLVIKMTVLAAAWILALYSIFTDIDAPVHRTLFFSAITSIICILLALFFATNHRHSIGMWSDMDEEIIKHDRAREFGRKVEEVTKKKMAGMPTKKPLGRG